MRLITLGRQERSIQSEHVFSMLDNAHAANRNPGDPFTSRSHFMPKICKRAGVKPFGFHAIRHLSAVILYKAEEPLNTVFSFRFSVKRLLIIRRLAIKFVAAETELGIKRLKKILRHQNATTTNRYLKSLGLEIEEMRSSVEVLARGPAKVIPLPKKLKPFEQPLKGLMGIHQVFQGHRVMQPIGIIW
jgi:hypothetical protein